MKPFDLEKYYERKHLLLIMRRNQNIRNMLDRATKTLAQDLAAFAARHPDGTGAQILRNSALQKKIDAVLANLNRNMYASIEESVRAQWALADEKNRKLVEEVGAAKVMKAAVDGSITQLNLPALNQFIKRKTAGMNLSTRVWNISIAQNKRLLEEYQGAGIAIGRSATKISQDVRGLLSEPEKLFRRVRDPETGKLALSQAAKAFHPGQGVYRSSYKNALRLAATETNMAYRRADAERRQELPFVLGIEVRLSASHPERDICDDMKGKYPVTFVFDGWHPKCLCYTTSVMLTREEMEKYLKTGEIDPTRYIKTVPESAAQYLLDNSDQLEAMKNQPFWFTGLTNLELPMDQVMNAAMVYEGIMTKGAVTSDIPLAIGEKGWNEGRKIAIDGNGEAVFKPRAGERPELVNGYGGPLFIRERASYTIAREIGFDNVPITVVRKVGRNKGSAQLWTAGTEAKKTGYVGGWGQILQNTPDEFVEWYFPEYSKMKFFDELTSNWDRHSRNFLIDETNMKLVYIDNGGSLMASTHQNSRFEPHTRARYMEMHLGNMKPQDAKLIKDNLGKLITSEFGDKLKAEGLDRMAIDNFQAGVNSILHILGINP